MNPLEQLRGEPMVICERCQMKVPERLATFGIGVRCGDAAWCAACKTPEGAEGQAKRAEVIELRKAHLLRGQPGVTHIIEGVSHQVRPAGASAPAPPQPEPWGTTKELTMRHAAWWADNRYDGSGPTRIVAQLLNDVFQGLAAAEARADAAESDNAILKVCCTPTEQPARGKFVLNAYGRTAWDMGYEEHKSVYGRREREAIARAEKAEAHLADLQREVQALRDLPRHSACDITDRFQRFIGGDDLYVKVSDLLTARPDPHKEPKK